MARAPRIEARVHVIDDRGRRGFQNGPHRIQVHRDLDLVAGDRRAAVVRRLPPTQEDAGLVLLVCSQGARSTRDPCLRRSERNIRDRPHSRRVDGRYPVVPGAAGVQADIFPFRIRRVRVGHPNGPSGGPLRRPLDPIAGNGRAAVVGGRRPGEIDPRMSPRGGRETGGSAGKVGECRGAVHAGGVAGTRPVYGRDPVVPCGRGIESGVGVGRCG